MPSSDLQLLTDAFDRHRIRQFGDSSLKVYGITPADGESETGSFEAAWKGHRVADYTSGVRSYDSGAWQFQIVAATDWRTSQDFMLAIVALKVIYANGSQERWKITKVEKPIGSSGVWKI